MKKIHSLSNIQKRIAVGVMAIAMLFGMLAYVPQAHAQTQGYSAEQQAMLTQIKYLMAIVAKLQRQVAELRAARSKTAIAPNIGYKLTQNAHKMNAGKTITFATLEVPGNFATGVRYLNQAELGFAGSQAQQPWNTFEKVEFYVLGRKVKSVDASDPRSWDTTVWDGKTAYSLDLYDSTENGYGAAWITGNVKVRITAQDDAASSGTENWTVFVPDNGIKIWTRQNGDVSYGGVGVSLSVSGTQSSNDLLIEQVKNLQTAVSENFSSQAPEKNYFACDRSQSKKYGVGSVACYGVWDYGNSFGGDEDMCGAYSDGNLGCQVKAPVCSSGLAQATKHYSNSQLQKLSSSKLGVIAYNLQTTTGTVKEEMAGMWEYTCVSDDDNSPSNAQLRALIIDLMDQIEDPDHEYTDNELNAMTNLELQSAANELMQQLAGQNGDTPTSSEHTSFWDLDANDQVYVVGAYEGSYPDGVSHSYGYHPQGEVALQMDARAGQIEDTMLVLTAYEPVKWKLQGDGTQYLSRVFLSGYYDQEITGIGSDVEVVHMSHESGDDQYFYAYDKNSRNFAKLRDYIEDQSGKNVYMYRGAYQLESVDLGIKG